MSPPVDSTKFKFDNPAVPLRYDELLVPRLFRPWADLLLDELQLLPGECVVDVAAGPGTVARLAAERVGRGGGSSAQTYPRPCSPSPALNPTHQAALRSSTSRVVPHRCL
jgi:SAM-dependent methyltransferase